MRIKGEADKRERPGPGEGRPPRLLLQPVAVIVAKTNKGGGESQERERERTVIASQSPSWAAQEAALLLCDTGHCRPMRQYIQGGQKLWSYLGRCATSALQAGGASHIQVNSTKGLKVMGHPVGGPAFSPLASPSSQQSD